MSEIKIHPLQQARKKLGIKQRTLADFTGLSETTIKRAERGEALDDYTIAAICNYFSNRLERQVDRKELGLRTKWESAESLNDVDTAPDNEEFSQKPSLHSNSLDEQGNVTLSQDQESDMDSIRRMLMQAMLGTVSASFLPRLRDAMSDMDDHINYAITRSSISALDEETLIRYKKITEGFWRLIEGSGLIVAIPVIEQTLPTYLSKLSLLAHQPSKYQKLIAGIAAHGYLLKGLVALDQLDFSAMDNYSKYSEQYSVIASDYNLQATALKQRATAFIAARDPARALQIYKKALPFIGQISPLLRSRIYQGLAGASARSGIEGDALWYLSMAYDTFPQHFKEDPSFLYADSNLCVLHLYAGITLLDLGQHEDAWEAFFKVDGLEPKIAIGDWTRLEFLSLQTKTATLMKDRDLSHAYLESCVKLANALDSKVGRRGAFEAWQQMKLVWPGDKGVKRLGDLFIQ